jgi:hypothetical protein
MANQMSARKHVLIGLMMKEKRVIGVSMIWITGYTALVQKYDLRGAVKGPRRV